MPFYITTSGNSHAFSPGAEEKQGQRFRIRTSMPITYIVNLDVDLDIGKADLDVELEADLDVGIRG